MQYYKPLSLALSVIPVTAFADCPTVSDLETGIRFTIEGNETETFRTTAPGVVTSIYTFGDGADLRVLLGQGVYLLELIDIENGKPLPDTRTTYSYPERPADLPAPQPDATWQTTAAVFENGTLRSETQSYTSGTPTRVSFGPCSYDMFPIEILYSGDQTSTDTLHYLPEFRISYLASSIGQEATDVYTYLSIEALK